MNKYFIEDTTLTDIADQLRLELDSTQTFPPEDMPLAIHLAATQGGGGGGRMILADTFGSSTPNKYLDAGSEKSYSGWSISPYYVIPNNARAVLIEVPIGGTVLSHAYAALYTSDYTVKSFSNTASNTNAFVPVAKTRFVLADCTGAAHMRVSATSKTIDGLKVYIILED